MQLKKIQIENLRSYEHQEINFPQGSTLLSGDIGSGKTTILLAIEFALFGLQPSQKGTSLLRSGKGEGRVILEFEIEGKNIIIERTLKKGKKSITQDYSSLTIDHEKFEGSITEIKSKILNLLNYPAEFAKKTNLLYKFTVYTPQEEMKQIILESGEIRLNTLRHVFGIDKYKRIEENASKLNSKLRERMRINEGIIDNLDQIQELLKQKKENLIILKENQDKISKEYESSINFKEQKQKSVDEIQERINEKKDLENQKSKSDILINEKQQQIKTLESSINSLKTQVQEAKKISFNEQEFNSINERIKFQENKESELQKQYIEIIGKINSNESKKIETQDLKNKISHLKSCPTCLQEVSLDHKGNISKKAEEEIQNLQELLNELNLKKNKFNEELESVKKYKEEFKNKKSELELLKIKLEHLKEKEQRILEIEIQKNAIQKDLDMLKKHVISIECSIKDYEKYNLIFKERQRELEEAKINENQNAIKKAEINKEIQFSEQEIKEKEQEIERKKEIKIKTEKIRELEYWISEKFIKLILFTEKQIMITLKQEFSKLFSQWFSMLVSDSLTAKLDDNFSPIIEQQDYELDYSFLSGGERTAIALAYRLSLNQVINSLLSSLKTSNLVILDEPTDGFSAQQLDKMRDVFSQLKTEQLILVSHEQKMEDFVDNIIRIKKNLGVSNAGI